MKIDHNTKITDLKKLGYKVEFMHWRYTKNDPTNELRLTIEFEDKRLMDEKGGHSRLMLTTPDGKNYEVETHCSRMDNFCTRRAQAICLGRVGKALNNESELDRVMKLTERGLLHAV